ncbi:MAG: hypothetical protein HOW73_31560 [Polyangiaceae bacterium]|nr:hypothetical protein [Polyangiaceae bacterium]
MVTKIDRVTDLVGAHPDTLASLFENAPPTDPEELGTTPRGLLLSLPAVSPVHLALRPLVLGLSRGGSIVWQGIEFDHGGNSGKNAVFGRGALRFRAERGSSFLDSMPALVLTYDKAPWPFSKLRDELRTIGTGIALGATFAGDKLVAWFGLTAG